MNDDPVTAAHVLRLGTRTQGVLDLLRRAGHKRPLLALAHALAASPPAGTLAGVSLAIREGPQPLLVFVGEVDAAGRARLLALEGLLEEASARLRIVSWADVETACERLAARIVDRLGPAAVERCLLVPIPRGGLVVAGLLAYALGVPRERVVALAEAARGDDDRVVVLVDDCILSGVRLREVVSTVTAHRLMVATLYSHPDLRDAVELREPRVVACVAAEDLQDHASDLLGDGAGGVLHGRRLDPGMPQLVSGPGQFDAALRDRCVEQQGGAWAAECHHLRRELADVRPIIGDLHLEMRGGDPVLEAVGRWCEPPMGFDLLSVGVPEPDLGLAPWEHDQVQQRGVVALGNPGTTLLIDTSVSERSIKLTGTADELWHAWIEAASVEHAARTVADRYGIAEARVETDLRDLLADLRRRSLVANGWR